MNTAKLARDRIIGLLLIVFSLVMLFVLIPANVAEVEGFGTSTRLFPQLFSSILGLLGVLMAVQRPTSARESRTGGRELSRVIAVVLVMLGYILVVRYLGFVLSGAIILAILIRFLGERRWWLILITAVTAPIIIRVFMQNLLRVDLPTGILP